ncbi:hypothetical protein TYRP_000262 [Tyrophagus putrescentiae]|nr:hypothetical protein TYRP_000262 [Tyrophagus putrescentiae]
MDSSSSGGPSTSSPEADMAGPSVAQSNSGASDQTLTTGQRKLSWWERFLQRIYSKEEFEAYLLNKDRRKKKDKEKKNDLQFQLQARTKLQLIQFTERELPHNFQNTCVT